MPAGYLRLPKSREATITSSALQQLIISGFLARGAEEASLGAKKLLLARARVCTFCVAIVGVYLPLIARGSCESFSGSGGWYESREGRVGIARRARKSLFNSLCLA
jgi:hypothetical protein